MPHFDISALTIPKFQNKLSPIADFYAAIRLFKISDVLTDKKIFDLKEVIDTEYFVFPMPQSHYRVSHTSYLD